MAIKRQSKHSNVDGEDPAELTLDSAPVQGNLLIAVGSDRSGGSAANYAITGITGWTQTIQRTILSGDATYRRTHSMYWKVAGASESSTVTLDDGTANSKYFSVTEYEFEAGENQWVLLDSISNDNGATDAATTMSTGTTASVSGDMFLVASFVSKRNGNGGSETISWDTGLSADYSHSSAGTFKMDHGIGSDASDTVTGTKSSTGTTSSGNNRGLSAALLVFDTISSGGSTNQSVSGSVTPAGAFSSKLILSNILTGSTISTGGLVKSISTIKSGSITESGSITKSSDKRLVGSSTFSGILATQLAFLLSISGGLTPSGLLSFMIMVYRTGTSVITGSIKKQCAKILLSEMTLSGNVIKRIDKILSGQLSLSATLSQIVVVLLLVAGNITISGVVNTVTVPATIFTKAIKGVVLKGIATIGKTIRGNDV